MFMGIVAIGGIFIRSKDSKAVIDWYRDVLGFDFDETGATVIPVTQNDLDAGAVSVFSIFPDDDAGYLEPNSERYVINFRVEGLKDYVEGLREKGVEITMEPVTNEYGTFAWIKDPDGRKIELCEAPETPPSC